MAELVESLHAFFDGNGRTGRLLLNWQLIRAGFPLTVIQVEERARYLGAPDQGHAGHLPICKPWSLVRSSAVWILRRVDNPMPFFAKTRAFLCASRYETINAVL